MSSGNHGNRIATGWIVDSPGNITIPLEFTPRYVRYFNVSRNCEGLWFRPMQEGTALLLRSTGAKSQVTNDGLGTWLGITPLESNELDNPDKPRGFFMSGQYWLNRFGDTVLWIAIE